MKQTFHLTLLSPKTDLGTISFDAEENKLEIALAPEHATEYQPVFDRFLASIHRKGIAEGEPTLHALTQMLLTHTNIMIWQS